MQIYIGYLIKMCINTYFVNNNTDQKYLLFPQNHHYMKSRYICVVDMYNIDETDVVMFTLKRTQQYTEKKRDHIIFISKKTYFKA